MFKVKVHNAAAWGGTQASSHFKNRDFYIMIQLSGDIAYVLDDNNHIRAVPVASLEVVSLEEVDRSKEKLLTFAEVEEMNRRRAEKEKARLKAEEEEKNKEESGSEGKKSHEERGIKENKKTGKEEKADNKPEGSENGNEPQPE